jgi:hypothetical protein
MLLWRSCWSLTQTVLCMSTEFVAGVAVLYNGKQYFVAGDSIDGLVTLSRPGLTGSFIVQERSTLLTLDQDQRIMYL